MVNSSFISSVRNIMREDSGVDGDGQRIRQIVWMLFLKVIDGYEKEKELEDNYSEIIPSKYKWRNWASDDEGITGRELVIFIDELFEELTQLESESKISEIVKEVFSEIDNHMNDGILIRKVINKINELDFTKSEDRHAFNDIYESILKELQTAGSYGEYYTPRPVTQFMADRSNITLKDTIKDPACGTGGFLISTLKILNKKVKNTKDRIKIKNSIFGTELKSLPYLLCVTNMLLHDIEDPNIIHDNSLATSISDLSEADKVSVFLANPPFGGSVSAQELSNFPKKLRSKESADLFMIKIMYELKKKGRAAIILPDGFLFGENNKTKIKEKLLDEFNLHTIVRLPHGVFAPYTSISTNLLFFEKGKTTEEVWYFEHPLPEGYKNYTKTKPIKYSEFDLEKSWWKDRENKEFKSYCWKVSVDEIKKNNYDLDIKNPKTTIETEIIASSDILKKIETSMLKSIDILKGFTK
jgi:type I restriction enzyme M protein